jgi:hypothetical protein
MDECWRGFCVTNFTDRIAAEAGLALSGAGFDVCRQALGALCGVSGYAPLLRFLSERQ